MLLNAGQWSALIEPISKNQEYISKLQRLSAAHQRRVPRGGEVMAKDGGENAVASMIPAGRDGWGLLRADMDGVQS
jgi:hypothetical protein